MATKHPSGSRVTIKRSDRRGMAPNTTLAPEKTPQDPRNLEVQVAQADRGPQTPAYATPPQLATPALKRSPAPTIAGRVIWFIGGVISTLLAFRFVLALLGANAANAFAHFIYSVTTPLVSQFFSLFGYTPTYGVSRLEVFTLVAIAVYVLVAWGLVKLVTVTRPQGQ